MDNRHSNRKYLVLMVGLGFFFILSTWITFCNRGVGFRQVFFCNQDDSFMDFFNVIFFSFDGNPYQGEAAQSYPPLCYLIFYLISKFISFDALIMGGKAIRASQDGIIMLLICYVLLVWGIIGLMKKMCDYKYKGLIIFLFLLSSPFLHALERGNIILLAFLFTMHFIVYIDSDDAKLREWALIALAMAAGIKIYPAVLGLVLIKEKRWKEILRIIIYGIIFFFGPFAFVGGFEKLKVFIDTLVNAVGIGNSVGRGPGYKVNYSNGIVMLMGVIKGHCSEKMYMVSSRLAYIVDIVAIIAAFFNKKKWQTIALLSCMIVGVPGFNYQYAVIFMIPAMLLFLNEEEKEKGDWIILALFVMQFALVEFGGIKRLEEISGAYPVTICLVLEAWSVLALTGVLVLKTLMSYIKKEGLQ